MQMWLERASKFIVWVIGVAIILDIFGIQIGPLIAGLGLFSVAVALGAQDFFKNLISGILIIGEHRFQPGDRIEVSGQLHGIVESIGFRSTVIRTFDTAPMVIPNKDLSDVKVINHGEMNNRRINWSWNSNYNLRYFRKLYIMGLRTNRPNSWSHNEPQPRVSPRLGIRFQPTSHRGLN